MARPKLNDGYTKIVNSLYEQFFIRDFSIVQLRVLLLLLRYSYGCNKKTAKIKPQNLLNMAYVYECDIKRELKHLERNKVITCNFEEKVFSLNKNFDEWKIPYHKLFDEEKLAKLLHINLCCGQSENFAGNKETEEAENETLLGTNETLCPEQSENFAGNKETHPKNTSCEGDLNQPKESIKKEKEIYSLSHDLEEGEREILFNFIKANKNIKNPIAYLRTIVENGDYKLILNEYKEKQKNAPPPLKELCSKVTTKRQAALLICNEGCIEPQYIEAQPPEIQELMKEWGFVDWNDAYNFEMAIEAEERRGQNA